MATQAGAAENEIDPTKPLAMAIPKEDISNSKMEGMDRFILKRQPVMASQSLRRSSRDKRMSSANVARYSRRQ